MTGAKAMAQARDVFGRKTGLRIARDRAEVHPHQVFLFHFGILADQLARDAAVLRQHEQAGRIDVKAPGGREAAQLRRREAGVARIAHPVAALTDQAHRRLMPVLGLPAHVADRLVQKNRDLAGLLTARTAVDLDASAVRNFQPDLRDRAIDQHPALRDPFVRLAPRTQAQFGHALVQAGQGGIIGSSGHGGLVCY